MLERWGNMPAVYSIVVDGIFCCHHIALCKKDYGGIVMNTMKFAITHIVGNKESIIKTFRADEKQQAIEFGKKSC